MPTYTAPTTRTTGELISAAIFNTDLVENIKYFKDAPAFAGNVTVGGTLGVTGATTLSSATYTTSLKSTTALATPGALSATQATAFASTVSGASIMGFGTTNDVALMNRAGTVVLGVGPNTTDVNMTGLLSVTGFGTNSFIAGGTGANSIAIRNTTAGSGNSSILALGNDLDASNVRLLSLSSTFSTSGQFVASGGVLMVPQAGGLSLAATHASGAIRFYSGGTTERMRIDTAGHAVIGATSNYSGAMLELVSPNIYSTAYCLNCKTLADSPAPGYFIAFSNSSNAVQGNIGNPTSTTTAYNTSSDIRLKNDLGVALTTILAGVVVHDFTWKRDGSAARGVFAQEVQSIAPFAVSVGKDHLTEDGTTLQHPWMVDYSKFVPDLIVGWQQHDATISQLAARIAALETKDN